MNLKLFISFSLITLSMSCQKYSSRESADKVFVEGAQTSGPNQSSDPDSKQTSSGNNPGSKDAVVDANGKVITTTGKITISLSESTLVSPYQRLSHAQWENSVKDLLQLAALPGLAKDFPNDPTSFVFGNNGAVFSINQNQWVAYRNAAETLGSLIGKDPLAVKKLIPAGVTDPDAIVSAFLRNAYRRPPTASEVSVISALYKKGPALTGITDPTAAGVSIMVTAGLQSPFFLYRTEIGSGTEQTYSELNAHELASRLSYAVWNSIPDSTLNQLADSSELLDDKVLKAQAERLLKDSRAAALMKNIHIKGYLVDKFVAVPQNAANYPEAKAFDTETLKKEAELFIEDVVINQKKGVVELFTAPYAFVSAKTAGAYEVNVTSVEPEKTELDPLQRAGILSQIAFLSSNSTESGQTAIIKRGHYIAETVLCDSFAGAPPSVDPKIPGDFKTNRERIAAISEIPGCAGCHATKINPPGFAFENFGPGGKWRQAELNGNPLDAKSAYPMEGEVITFDGPVELMKKIADTDKLHQCYAKKLVEGLYGRFANSDDQRLIEALGKASREGMSPQDIVLNILSHPKMKIRTN